MKKIFLRINQKGIFIKINKNKVRTPVVVDITNMKIDKIITQIKSYGITDYDIYTDESKKVDNENVIYIDCMDNKIDNLILRIEKIEKILYRFDNNGNHREQNIKDYSNLIKKENIKNNTNKNIKNNIIKETSENKYNKIEKNIKNVDINKKILIEELEEPSGHNIKVNDDFNTKSLCNVKSFETNPLIEELSKLKKNN